MLQFPSEDERIAELSDLLRKQFDLSRRIFSFWLHAKLDRYIEKSPLDFSVISTAMALNTQACRQFRSAVELCSRCEGACAHVISRTLFETAVATCFVLFPRVRLFTDQRVDKSSGAPLTHSDGSIKYCVRVPARDGRRKDGVLSRGLRAKLFLANNALQDYTFAESRKNRDGQKRIAKRVGSNVPPEIINAIQAEIGDPWLSILRQRPYTYSGLSLSRLVKVLGNRLDYWYDTIYHFQSRDSHSISILQHGDLDESDTVVRSWYTRPDWVEAVLHTANAMFLVHLSVLQDNIGFGVTMETALNGFREEHCKL